MRHEKKLRKILDDELIRFMRRTDQGDPPSKKKIAALFLNLIEKHREQFENEWDVSLDVLDKKGF